VGTGILVGSESLGVIVLPAITAPLVRITTAAPTLMRVGREIVAIAVPVPAVDTAPVTVAPTLAVAVVAPIVLELTVAATVPIAAEAAITATRIPRLWRLTAAPILSP